MAIEIRTATDDDWPAFAHADARNFGFSYAETDLVETRPLIDPSRFVLALDGAEIVGVAGSYALDVTLPGGSTVPMGGVTWVSVSATHRRQGVLTRMMAACHDDIDARGEPVAALFASESGIYERFGYGLATMLAGRRIETRRAALQQRFQPAAGSVRFMEIDEARDVIPAMWERYRRTRPGELSRSDAYFDRMFAVLPRERDGASGTFLLRHADGYACYRIASNWNEGFPAHELRLTELVALTPDAHAALWHTVLNIDLVGTVVTRQVPVDDPLPYLLDDPRSFQTVSLTDGVWVNVRDVAIAFGARTYAVPDRLVVELTDGPLAGRRVAIEGGPDGGACRTVRSRPDLSATHAALGALLYGGVTASALAAGRRLTARSGETLRRADRFFTTTPTPACLTYF
jgi:predicted acetyltransferase